MSDSGWSTFGVDGTHRYETALVRFRFLLGNDDGTQLFGSGRGDASRHVHPFSQLEEPNDATVGTLDRDQRAGVEHYRPRTLRAHAVSSSVAGPRSALISASTSRRLSIRARSAIASATQALTDGARPSRPRRMQRKACNAVDLRAS